MKFFKHTKLYFSFGIGIFIFFAASHVFADTTIASTTSATSTALETGFLSSYHQNATMLFPQSLNTFYPVFKANGNSIQALVDIELFDQEGKQLLQKSWDNVTISSVGSSTQFSLTSPRNLSPGVYTWKTALFTPGWKETIHWYDDAASFVVIGTSTNATEEKALLGGLWQKSNTLKAGEAQDLIANFTTAELSLPTYLQLDLFNDRNAIVAEKSIDNVYLGKAYMTTETVTSPELSPGNYHWAIGIFTLGRKIMTSWIDNLAPFTVASSTDSLYQ